MELTRNLLKKSEVLRYLGYKGSEIPKNTERLIEGCILETLGMVRPSYTYRRFPVTESESGILVGDTGVCLTGEAVRKHLAGCQEVYLFCGTVGNFVDKNIRLKMVMEPSAGVVLDSCGSVAVEQVMEAAEQEIEQEAAAEGKHITWRFSPGYGDLPLELQRDFVELLDTHRKLGVGVSESFLLTPTKSVTALVGVLEAGSGQAGDSANSKCDRCTNRERCNFHYHGKSC